MLRAFVLLSVLAFVGRVSLTYEVQAQAGNVEPLHFGDYPAAPVYRGKIKFPDFHGRDKADAIFRTRITQGMREGPNFAGKYTVIQVGCGGGCRFYSIADLTTGRVIQFPLGGEEYGHLDLHFRLESGLVIAVWDDYAEKCFQEAFQMDKGSLRSLGRSSTPRQSTCEPQNVTHLRSLQITLLTWSPEPV
jgi:hypothetical protein